MRISDWSSDVCSSDLCIFQIVAVLASCIVDQYVDTAEVGADGGDEIDDRLLIGHVDMIGPGLPALCNDRCSIFFGLRHLDVDEGYCCAHSGKIPRNGGPHPLCCASNDGHFSVQAIQLSDIHQHSHLPIECRLFCPE